MNTFIKTLKTIKNHLFDIIVSLLFISAILYHFLFGTVLVSGQSMEPSYYDGDLVIVQSFNLDLTSGDVVSLDGERISEYNGGGTYNNMIKRVVAVPGDTVTIEDNNVFVNGVLEEADYIVRDMVGNANQTIDLAEDEFFVLGDNRNFSADSRSFGPVHRDAITSRALLTIYSNN